MITIRLLKQLGILASILLLVGCISMDRGKNRAPVEDAYGARASGLGNHAGFVGQEINYGSLADGTVYFAFDSNALTQETKQVLDSILAQTRYQGDIELLLEGHTDERGTSEYNLGLGERRANAVRQYLVEKGANNALIETVSYGDTRPAVLGDSEESFWQNRRVEIYILN